MLIIFTCLGFGLAVPYLLFAARPGWIARLPKPGPWMIWVKYALAAAMALTALWLLSVLWAAAGLWAAASLALLTFALLVLVRMPMPRRGLVAALAFGMGLLIPATLATAPQRGADTAWAPLDMAVIEAELATGGVVFVDVTADWCRTCKANKALVLNRARVSVLLAASDVMPMQGDWTRPVPAISAYLRSFGRYGIPFNAVYGPSAPNGIALPELLTARGVEEAIAQAR